VPVTVEAGQSLQRVETLLDQALKDLIGDRSSAPCSQCPELLAEALKELQGVGHLLGKSSRDETSVQARVNAILPRLSLAERLLSASAGFYFGWCAAGSRVASPAAGYYADSMMPGPSLLALEG
jgi:hypothetical protein